jgi:hypothetical protein
MWVAGHIFWFDHEHGLGIPTFLDYRQTLPQMVF